MVRKRVYLEKINNSNFKEHEEEKIINYSKKPKTWQRQCHSCGKIFFSEFHYSNKCSDCQSMTGRTLAKSSFHLRVIEDIKTRKIPKLLKENSTDFVYGYIFGLYESKFISELEYEELKKCVTQ